MANPQIEDGYTRIANEILENLIAFDLSGQEVRVTLFVIRKTYGFRKTEDIISLSQVMDATGMSKVRASQVVNRLQLMKILTVTENINGVSKKYKFNKDFQTWLTVKENINRYGKPLRTVKEKRNRPLRKTLTTKETITKENIKERGKRFIPPNYQEIQAYCKERNNSVDPQRFIDHYTSNGWMVGRNKMKDWKAAIRTWEKNNVNSQSTGFNKQNRGNSNIPAYEPDAEQRELDRKALEALRRQAVD
ncbi:MAG: replication protein [Limnochordia bacterium]|nr:replication protein [Limnochordia bacterium]